MTCPVDMFLSVSGNLEDPARRWLISQGVPPGIIEVSPGPLATATIEADDLGSFQFSKSGKQTFVHPITCGGPFTDIVDLIAWRPGNPAQCWTLLYSGTPLGVDQLDRAMLLGEPLLIHPTPLDWLRFGGTGTYLPDWKMSESSVRRVPFLVVENAEFGSKIRTKLSRSHGKFPEIRVLTKEAA